ncbi:hypothetical protein JCM15548_1909 [Geofilum rubicundum JCM 15548]|uniref:Flavodoxin-like domain-containing protein n=1 Tax=Geofilum rubicundum JCM 15548 TaxID=1236989 RepID=A0A0E9LUF7_9BACT|nr:hypothetical protein JCM15548_1909 [Geofilum rubicundum JCM 15548]
MKKVGIFYSFRSVKTHQQVKHMIKHLGADNCEEVDADVATLKDFKKFDNYIFAVPTWFDGELPNYWMSTCQPLRMNHSKVRSLRSLAEVTRKTIRRTLWMVWALWLSSLKNEEEK